MANGDIQDKMTFLMYNYKFPFFLDTANYREL